MDVGEGREQDAEASPARIWIILVGAASRRDSRRGRRSYKSEHIRASNGPPVRTESEPLLGYTANFLLC